MIDLKIYLSFSRISELLTFRVLAPWLYPDFMFQRVPAGKKQKKYLEILHGFTNRVIKEREINFKDSDVENLNDEETESGEKKKRFALLDHLIKEKKDGNIDLEGIREEVDTFMFAVGNIFQNF